MLAATHFNVGGPVETLKLVRIGVEAVLHTLAYSSLSNVRAQKTHTNIKECFLESGFDV